MRFKISQFFFMTLFVITCSIFVVKIILSLTTKEKTEISFIESDEEEEDESEFELMLFFIENEFHQLIISKGFLQFNEILFHKNFISNFKLNILIEPPEK